MCRFLYAFHIRIKQRNDRIKQGSDKVRTEQKQESDKTKIEQTGIDVTGIEYSITHPVVRKEFASYLIQLFFTRITVVFHKLHYNLTVV